MWGRQKERESKKEKKKDDWEKIKQTREVRKERRKVAREERRKVARGERSVDDERMAVVAKDLQLSHGGGGGATVGQIKGNPELIEAIRQEQRKLKLLKKEDFRKKPATNSPKEKAAAAKNSVHNISGRNRVLG